MSLWCSTCLSVLHDAFVCPGRTKARPLASWPTWLLRAVLRYGIMRGLWFEVGIEIHQRDIVEPTRAAADDESGPWLVSPPRGMH